MTGQAAAPVTDRLRRIHPDADVQAALAAEGFHSAVAISHHSQGEFLRRLVPRLAGDHQRAREAYSQARRIANSVMHTWATVHTAVRDPHFGALKVANLGTGAGVAFDELPSYQELFGSPGCSCPECESVLGAAAYLVDLLRIIDAYVTQPNSPLPPGYAFADRRPDIGGIPLTCDAVNDTFPMIRVVNERLTALAATYLGNPPDLAQALAGLSYPFGLPFHQPWEQVLRTVQQIKVPLSQVYTAFGAAAPDIARANFGISHPALDFVSTSLAGSPDALATSYGITAGELAGLAEVPAFLTATGLRLGDLMSLLQQDLTGPELTDGVAAGFFINLGLSGKWLSYEAGEGDTSASIAGLAAAPADPLDRISRFVRLAGHLGWDYPTLDWALRSVGGGTATISAQAVGQLDAVARLASQLHLDVTTVCATFGSIKPYGAAEAPSQFDGAFNDPRLVGTDVYQPPTPLNPGYRSDLREWTVGSADPAQRRMGARLASATALSLPDLQALATSLWGAGTTVPLSFDNLASLYRHATLSRALRLAVGDYRRLLALLGYRSNQLLPSTLELADVVTIASRAGWLAASGLSLDLVEYFLGGELPATVDPLFQAAAVPDWLSGVRTVAGAATGDQLQSAVTDQLALLFNISPEVAKALSAQAAAATTPPAGLDWPQVFVAAPDPEGRYLSFVLDFLAWVSRWLVLNRALRLPAPLLLSLLGQPQAYGMAKPADLTSVYWLWTFQQLVASYGDQAGRLMGFVDPSSQPGVDPVASLAAATGWAAGPLTALLDPYQSTTNRVLVVQALDAQFQVLAKLGADPAFASRLVKLTTDPGTTWADYTGLADQVRSLVRARIPDGQWPAIADQLDGVLQARLRDVLVPLVLSKLRTDHADISSLNNLSDYLLIDVETGAVPRISRIREALNAAQQYLHRCQLGLEPIDVLEIPHAWWQWLTSYAVWRANRQVFLYPENYLDPAIRRSKTDLFSDLQNRLQQGDVTDGAVDDAYRGYLDGLVALSDLEYVDAYRCTVNDAEQGPVDTTYLFARTATDPFRYYTISSANGLWGSWRPIGITIPAPQITPVYAFNRLFVFWVELKIAKDAQLPAGRDSTQGVAYQATIRYSFVDFNGNWIQPQALTRDQVVYYMPNESDQAGALCALSDRLDLFNMSDLFWNKVSAVVVDPPTAPGGHPDPALQKLVISYGSLLAKDANSKPLVMPASPPAPMTNPGSNALMFAQRIYKIISDYNQLVRANLYGYLPLTDPIVLDHQLNRSFVRRPNEMIVLETDLRENAPPLVKPEIEQVLGTLALATADCAYVADALADWAPPVATTRPPLPVTADSFVGGPISATASQAAYNALVSAGTIVNGAVSPSFAGNPDLSSLLPVVGAAGVPRVRAVLLRSLGDPTLFASVPVKTAQVISVRNRLGSFVLAVGDEAFLLTPRDVSYADLSRATKSTPMPSSAMVFDSYFRPVSADNYHKIYLDLVGNSIISRVEDTYGLLTPSFNERTDLSALFAGEPSPARKASLIEQVRRILLALPSVTMLTYDDTSIGRFVTQTSFISTDINEQGSRQAFQDLVGNGLITTKGVLIVEISATTDLSQILEGAPDSIREEVRAVLMELPKLVQQNSFANQDISETQSQQAFTALVSAGVLDSVGAVSASFTAGTDLSFLFDEVPQPTRDVLIDDVRAVLWKFFDATYRIDSNSIPFDVERISARTSSRELSYALFAGGVGQVLSLESQNAPVIAKLPFDRLAPSSGRVGAPPLADGAQIDFDGPYGHYYWELFFHAPLMVASMLATNQQFEAAKRWLQFVLDPTAAEQLVTPDSFITVDITQPDSAAAYSALLTANVLVAVEGGARVDFGYTPTTPLGPHFAQLPTKIVDEYRAVLSNYQLATPASHYWQFRPFRNHTLQSLLETLTDVRQIKVYEDDPFDPDAIARLRIGAYEKSTVMAFLDVLLAWGDALFTQYTWESVTSATLCYQFAEDLLGPRPVDAGRCPTPASTLTFDQIKAMYADGKIPEFLIDLEDQLPAMTATAPRMAPQAVPVNALDAYFGVPANDHLTGYWDRVGDRLGKIRNGENIDGVPTPLALWDPPLNPMDLVRAAASGNGVLPASANPAAKPNSAYRFKTLFEHARQLAGGVKELGAALLAALQSQDAATLDLLRTTQETALLNLTTAIKQQQIDELQKTIDGLNLNLAKSQYQADYYNGLKSAGLNAQEVATRVLDAEAILFQAVSVPIRGIAIAGYLAPSIFGLADGGMQWGEAINQGAEIAAGTAQLMSMSSALTSVTGEFERRSDEWDFQAQLATRDVAILKNQIDTATVQLAAAQQDLLVHQKSIEQANQVSTFLAARFTSADLYTWLAGRLSAVYFQSYTAAVAAARSAELAYQYEQNRTDSYIVYDYWDSLHRGLGAGETLVQSLNQLQAAYLDADHRKLEIEKTVSLRQLDPKQILNLRAGRPATFTITETMLDFDFPGHYGRQLSSVSVSIPAVVGPYQNINAVLTQTANRVVLNPDKSIVDYLVTLDSGQTPGGGPPSGLRQDWQAQQEIAISRGSNDSGMFELDFTGDKYMPFEGTGAVSSWQLAIPPENNRLDLSQLTDVVITLRYTALDGGSTFDGSPSFRTDVIGVLRKHNMQFTGRLYLDAAQSFPSAWYAFLNPAPDPATQTLTLDLQPGMLPYLSAPVLTDVVIKMTVGPTVASTDSTDFVSLSVAGHTWPLTFTGGLATLTGLDLAAAEFLRSWSLRLTLANAPDPHLIANGALDPTALLDFELILSYRADVLPPAP